MINRILSKRTNVYLSRFEGKNVLLLSEGANFFGQESLRYKQIRGNGVLVLTSEELFFGMWLPKREYLIPLENIHSFDTPKSFLGKSRFQPLLKVTFTNDKGQTDSCAWLVRDVHLWVERIQEYVDSKKKRK